MASKLKDSLKTLEEIGLKVQEKAANKTRAEKVRKAHDATGNATNHSEDDYRVSAPHKLANETLHVGLNHTNTTIFEPPDPLLLASRMFRSPNEKTVDLEANPNATYETTIGLIILLHLVFIYQWNKRRSRRDVLTSYDKLVKKKQIHSAVVALFSHPPADSSFLSRERMVSLAIEMGDSNTTETGRLGRLRNKCKSFVECLHPLTYGHLSGLPLLCYNSHLIWSCRALEAICPSSLHYARFMVVLVFISFLLELRFTHNLLQTSRAVVGLDSGTPSVSESRRYAKHRTMGTPTMLTAALLLTYYCCFPFVPIPVLPFLPVSRRMDVGLSYFICYTLLTALSWKSHPLTCVLFGMLSGFLWTLGITSFLGEVYWSACIIAGIVVASLLSLRVSHGGWLPWIDYVAWDDRGRIRYDETNLDEQYENEEVEEEPENDIESRPLLDRRSDSNSGLRGRLPMMDMDDDIEMPARTSGPSRGLQQRRGGR